MRTTNLSRYERMRARVAKLKFDLWEMRRADEIYTQGDPEEVRLWVEKADELLSELESMLRSVRPITTKSQGV